MHRPNFEDAVPLVVIFHDPLAVSSLLFSFMTLSFFRPELMGTPHHVTHKLELHNTWLVSCVFHLQRSLADFQKADDSKHYVDWAANLGYGVVDVNVPKHLTSTEVCSGQIQRSYGCD